MYVCVCNAVTDRQIRSQCERRGVARVSDVYRALGVKPRCGKCVPTVKTILDAAPAPHGDLQTSPGAEN